MEIVYCDNCGFKLDPREISGSRTDDGKVYCSKCAPLYQHPSSALLAAQLPISIHDKSTQKAIPVSPAPAAIENSVTKFYFCETCGKRITDKQILDGLGRDKKLKGVYCKDCAVGVMTMEMDAININQLAKAKPKTPSPSASDQAEPRSSTRRPSGIVSAHQVPRRDTPQRPAQKAKNDRFLVPIAASVVFGSIVAFIAVKQHTTPHEGVSQTIQAEAAPKLSAPPDTIPPSPPLAKLPEPPGVNHPPVDPKAPEVAKVANETPKNALPTATDRTQTVPPVAHSQPSADTEVSYSADLPKEMALDLGGGVKMEVVLIPVGEFERSSNERSASVYLPHKVKISQLFYMGKYAVTQAQYEKVVGKNPSHFKGENHPVEWVNFTEAEEFCAKAGKLTGKLFRLPTEAEWEYACRAGTTTTFNTGDNEVALDQAGWFSGNADGKTHPVGQKRPNAWGLYDMHGNVWQWCHDWYAADYYSKSVVENPQGPTQGAAHVLRGGSFHNGAGFCRAYNRYNRSTEVRETYIGFRVCVAPAVKP